MAVTRARRHIAVVCDTQTVQNHAFLRSLVNHMTEFGEVRTAFEYLQDIVPQNYVRDHRDSKLNTSSSSSMSTNQKVKDQPPRMAKPSQKKSFGSSSKESDNKHIKSCTSTLTEEEQKKNRQIEIREQVDNFLKDFSQNELQFPSSFNSHDRLLVHQIAEELGLLHESKGEGKDRCISVSKHPGLGSRQAEPTKAEEVEEVPAAQEQENIREDPVCPLDLKSLHLERMKREQQKREENAQQKKQQNISAPQAHSSKKAHSAKGLLNIFFYHASS